MSDSQFQSPQMPEDYAAKMRAARRDRAMRGERRIITMLFCDVVGSTAMAGQLDPEEWAEIMNEAFEYLITPIYRYEGTVARLLGDAILAFFGAPIAHEDDPQRAILAGLAIVEGISSFAAEISREYGLDFNVRVGINTGPVVVGEVGTDLALEYTAMGDAINLASRMESTAETGTVQITADTYELIAPLFHVQDVGEISVKGREDPVQAYRVLGQKARPGRLRGISGLNTPLIGRSQELSTLTGFINNLHKRQGQIISLSGEAGLGKSRLVAELQAAFAPDIAQNKLGWLESRGISYDSSRPYSAIMQMFRQQSGVTRSDPAPIVRQKIRARISTYIPEVQESMAHALDIMLAVEGEADQPAPEGEALKRELFAAFLTTLRDSANKVPVVAVFDDLQWADSASIELLIHLLQLVDSTPCIFICSYRPGQQSPAEEVSEVAAARYADRFTEIALKPLTTVEGTDLVNNLISRTDLPPTLYHKILNKSDGNPFFIEEVLRVLIGDGALIHEGATLRWRSEQDIAQIEIPDNVLSLLVSRIDRLEKESKQTLQLASVIGRTFYERVLARISDPSLALDEHLLELQTLEMILQEAGLSEQAYIFRQSLTRDAAYQSILHRQRRRYHLRVGEALEQLFPQNLAEEAHRLAYHFFEARDYERALEYFTMAGDQAARLYANTEAIDQYGRALEIALNSGTDEQLIYLYTARGRTFEVSGRYAEAVTDYQALDTAATTRHNRSMRLEALLAEAVVRSTYNDQYDLPRGRELLQESLALAQELGNRRAQSKIYWNLMLQETNSGVDPQEVVALGEKAVAIAREDHLRLELAYALHDLARPYTRVGQIQQAAAALEESGQLWRELGKMPMLADNRATLASGYRHLGRLDEALNLATEALQISQKISSYWGEAYSRNILGPIYLDLGLIDQALDSWERANLAAIQANFIGAQTFLLIDHGLAYAYLGDTARGMAFIEQSIARLTEMQQTQMVFLPSLAKARIHLYDGDIAAAAKIMGQPVPNLESIRTDIVTSDLFITVESLVGFAAGNYEQAISHLDAAITTAETIGLIIPLLQLLLLKGNALSALNRTAEATAVLTKARTTAQAIGCKKQLWLILGALAQLEDSLGHASAAQALRQEAQTVIGFIAGQISDPDLRRSFLNLPAVTSISKSFM